MNEYPSIINSKKAPRKYCIAFDKLDGSNLRFAYNHKKGFCKFGTRTQLIDESTPVWGDAIKLFRNTLENSLLKVLAGPNFKPYKEITVFCEYFGENSFAGSHDLTQPMKLVMFDVLCQHKQAKFLKPDEFISIFSDVVETPRVVYTGELTDAFISDVRKGAFDVKEGVICKGIQPSGAFVGGVWQCKIKTQAYLDKLKHKFGDDWVKHGE